MSDSAAESMAVPFPLDGWYHTMELAPGVVTRGLVDLRDYLDAYELPERMDGMRALDIGTQDGFWAFEMERRGAQVVALNHPLGGEDRPPRDRDPEAAPLGQDGRFHFAKAMLKSNVQHVSLYVTEARPEDLGTFDVIMGGSVLVHVRDQLLALERIAKLCRGTFISVEPYDRMSGLLPFPSSRYRAHTVDVYRKRSDRRRRDGEVMHGWYSWKPSMEAWEKMIWTAGFDEIDRRRKVYVPSTIWDIGMWHVVNHARKVGPEKAQGPSGVRR